MKILKYLAISALVLAMASCDKHEILYNTEPVSATDAEFQLHYFEPVTNTSAYYIDSVFVNDVLYSSVDGSGQLLPYNGVPGGATGRFFSIPAGETNFKFYRKGALVYNQTATLTPGKQNVFVYDLDKAPVVVDNQFPYWDPKTATGTAETFDTDSVAKVMFCNFLFEQNDAGEIVPYSGTLQYQWRDPRTTASNPTWYNVGEPVAFGEVTTRTTIKVVKTVHNSSGYCSIYYRILDSDGNVLKIINSAGTSMGNYSDYWNTYIGRSYMHIFGGIRNALPRSSVRVWTSL